MCPKYKDKVHESAWYSFKLVHLGTTHGHDMMHDQDMTLTDATVTIIDH